MTAEGTEQSVKAQAGLEDGKSDDLKLPSSDLIQTQLNVLGPELFRTLQLS